LHTRMNEAEALLADVEGPEALEEMRAAARRIKPSLRANLEGLAHFTSIFMVPGFQFATWRQKPPDESGILHFPYSEPSREADEFVEAAYELGWVKQFDWSAWMCTPEWKKLTERPDLRRQRDELTTIMAGMSHGIDWERSTPESTALC
jgi:hypothetical protein